VFSLPEELKNAVYISDADIEDHYSYRHRGSFRLPVFALGRRHRCAILSESPEAT
jgi:hypothetical protein